MRQYNYFTQFYILRLNEKIYMQDILRYFIIECIHLYL
jgi:hypothetical protein